MKLMKNGIFGTKIFMFKSKTLHENYITTNLVNNIHYTKITENAELIFCLKEQCRSEKFAPKCLIFYLCYL